jgi:hypothetical protein
VNERHIFYSFIALLITMVIMAVCGAFAAWWGKDASVYLATITGLIGVIGSFTKTRTGSQNIEKAETVNQGTAAP